MFFQLSWPAKLFNASTKPMFIDTGGFHFNKNIILISLKFQENIPQESSKNSIQLRFLQITNENGSGRKVKSAASDWIVQMWKLWGGVTTVKSLIAKKHRSELTSSVSSKRINHLWTRKHKVRPDINIIGLGGASTNKRGRIFRIKTWE